MMEEVIKGLIYRVEEGDTPDVVAVWLALNTTAQPEEVNYEGWVYEPKPGDCIVLKSDTIATLRFSFYIKPDEERGDAYDKEIPFFSIDGPAAYERLRSRLVEKYGLASAQWLLAEVAKAAQSGGRIDVMSLNKQQYEMTEYDKVQADTIRPADASDGQGEP